MEEEDYKQLQDSLSKLRIFAMKDSVKYDNVTRIKERDFKIIRYIDWLRKNVPLNIKKEED